MCNHLKDQSSPYLLQHAENPVHWYPWCEEAFQKAKEEDKPIFLSIGYSTCHWCHVMARESFEDPEIAGLLNDSFISVKVDREERPDIDSVYMSVCQAFTGSGGWPASIFMTAEQKPFFAGTYFPKTSRHGMPGFRELLLMIRSKWENDRTALFQTAQNVAAVLAHTDAQPQPAETDVLDDAVRLFKNSYDPLHGGFGPAPKFPAAHNLLFLMAYYEKSGDAQALQMAEQTLLHMYLGGMFDHIGYGFCRYSTDRFFLVPHFEKMLYDNALLILAYSTAYQITKKPLYLRVAENTAAYILREMTSDEGAFYSAQDADSDGQEGRFYLFRPEEITGLLGKADGEAFNRCYGITDAGNFEGQSIPNLLHNPDFHGECDRLLPAVRTYRRARLPLGTDDKILTGWNALTTAALCALYRVSRNSRYLDAARRNWQFISNRLRSPDGTLYAGCRGGKRGCKGFLDDYADVLFALLSLYGATLESCCLQDALCILKKAVDEFHDPVRGGFYLYGGSSEPLISRPKDTYDGALPSGNGMMAWSLVRLQALTGDPALEPLVKKQLDFVYGQLKTAPIGYTMSLMALSDFFDPPVSVTAAVKDRADIAALPFTAPLSCMIRLPGPDNPDFPMKDRKTTFYVCSGRRCLPPTNSLDFGSGPASR